MTPFSCSRHIQYHPPSFLRIRATHVSAPAKAQQHVSRLQHPHYSNLLVYRFDVWLHSQHHPSDRHNRPSAVACSDWKVPRRIISVTDRQRHHCLLPPHPDANEGHWRQVSFNPFPVSCFVGALSHAVLNRPRPRLRISGSHLQPCRDTRFYWAEHVGTGKETKGKPLDITMQLLESDANHPDTRRLCSLNVVRMLVAVQHRRPKMQSSILDKAWKF